MSTRALSPFPTTHWTVLAATGAADREAARAALASVLRRYLPALHSYLVARFRLPADRVDDILQGFLADKILDRAIIVQADRARGRFRTFLCTALERYAISDLRKDRAGVRRSGPGDASADAREPAARASADAFDVAWARQVLELALEHTRAECEAGGRSDLWAVFEGRVLRPTVGDAEPAALDELVARLGVAPERVSNLLVTAKRMFARNLKAVVARYAVDDQDVDDELNDLRRILGQAGA